MKALITGGAGFIGSHLAEQLLQRGHEVGVIDNLSTGSIENISHLKIAPGFSYVIDTIDNESLLAEWIDRSDVVFHLAAAVGVKLIVERPVHTIETNVHGTEVVLKHANKKKKLVVLASTSEVYGKSTDVPFREKADLVLGATSKHRWAYACSKLLDEFLALAYWKERKLPVVIVRLFNTVGPRQTGQYGMVLPTFVRQALGGQPITVFGDGRQSRSFTYVGDVVDALIALASEARAVGEVFNIGNTTEVTIRHLAERVKTLTSSESLIQYSSVQSGLRGRLRGHAEAGSGYLESEGAHRIPAQAGTGRHHQERHRVHTGRTRATMWSMRSRSIVAVLIVLLGASSASAQVLSLEFHDGRIRLTAENVPVSRILDEWARRGGTKIVNGERVPGPPVTLQLTDVPERQALEIVLRGAAGYMVLARDTITPGASAFDKILVLPTTSRAPAAAAPPPRNPRPRRRNSRIDPTRTSISMSQRRILRGHLPAHSREVEYLRMPLRTRRRQQRMRSRHKMTLRRRRQEIRSVSSRVVRAQVRSMRLRRETCPTHNRPRVNGSFRSRARSSSVVQIDAVSLRHVRHRPLPSRRSPRRRPALSAHVRRRRC